MPADRLQIVLGNLLVVLQVVAAGEKVFMLSADLRVEGVRRSLATSADVTPNTAVDLGKTQLLTSMGHSPP